MSAADIMVLLGGGTAIAGFIAVTARNDRARRRAVIAEALGYDLSPAVEAHVRRTGVPRAEAERLDREFRRWFVAATTAPTMIGMGSKAVDEYWHTLLDVEGGGLYAAFSIAVAGRLIEHVEGVGSPELDAKAWIAYEAVWGDPPPADLFPEPPKDLRDRCTRRANNTGSAGGGGCGGGGNSCGDGGGSSSGGGGSCGGGGGCGSG